MGAKCGYGAAVDMYGLGLSSSRQDQVHTLLREAPMQVKGRIARLLDREPNTRPTPADMLSWRWISEEC